MAAANFPPLPLDSPPHLVQDGEHIRIVAGSGTSGGSLDATPSPTTLSQALTSPEGIDCYGNERQALTDQAKFYNNVTLSDITLVVGGSKYFAHKLILVRSSDVFERMLSSQWSDTEKSELELVEEVMCIGVFPRFLKFLYSCHVPLNMDNALPVLILADKYNVVDLRDVCINFACSFIIPKMQLKDVFHVWFHYATKCYHRKLIHACVKALAERMDDITMSAEWQQEWDNLEKEQLIEFLKSSDLAIKDEYDLWLAVLKWMQSADHPKRSEPSVLVSNLHDILEYIRFPMLTAEQLCRVENSELAQQQPQPFQKHFMLAYKYHALPLTSRVAVKEFTSPYFMLRNYTDLRWDRRFVIPHYTGSLKYSEAGLRFSTRASTFPAQTWDWELKVYPKGFSSTCEDFRVILYSNLILDQPRPVEYLLSIVGQGEIMQSVCGKKNFSKTRYTADTEMDKKVSVADFCQINSPLLVDDNLIMQIVLRPAS